VLNQAKANLARIRSQFIRDKKEGFCRQQEVLAVPLRSTVEETKGSLMVVLHWISDKGKNFMI
jgi:hypothetical protein